MKRLGMWNRLAIVLAALATFIAPAVIALDIQSDLSDMRDVWYEQCLSFWKGRELESGYIEGRSKCIDELIQPSSSSPWDDYWEMALATLIVCAILYGLIWAIVATVKWVWRGRQVNQPQP